MEPTLVASWPFITLPPSSITPLLLLFLPLYINWVSHRKLSLKVLVNKDRVQIKSHYWSHYLKRHDQSYGNDKGWWGHSETNNGKFLNPEERTLDRSYAHGETQPLPKAQHPRREGVKKNTVISHSSCHLFSCCCLTLANTPRSQTAREPGWCSLLWSRPGVAEVRDWVQMRGKWRVRSTKVILIMLQMDKLYYCILIRDIPSTKDIIF